jgi:hypothetical protein
MSCTAAGEGLAAGLAWTEEGTAEDGIGRGCGRVGVAMWAMKYFSHPVRDANQKAQSKKKGLQIEIFRANGEHPN